MLLCCMLPRKNIKNWQELLKFEIHNFYIFFFANYKEIWITSHWKKREIERKKLWICSCEGRRILLLASQSPVSCLVAYTCFKRTYNTHIFVRITFIYSNAKSTISVFFVQLSLEKYVFMIPVSPYGRSGSLVVNNNAEKGLMSH